MNNELAMQQLKASRSRLGGEAMVDTVSAFRTAMNAMDVATRPGVSEALEPNVLRDVFSELTYIAQMLLHEYEGVRAKSHETWEELNVLRHDHRKLAIRYEAREAERDSMEELWIRTKMDMQDIAEQANELNTDLWNTRRELHNANADAKSYLATEKKLCEEMRQIKESFLEVSQERNAAFGERDDAKDHAADLKGGLEEARSHIVKLRTLAHNRRNLLATVDEFLRKLPHKGKLEPALADLLKRTAEGRKPVDYATYQPVDGAADTLSNEADMDIAVPNEPRLALQPVTISVDTTEQEIAGALPLLRRMHEWQDVATEDGVQTICKFCGIAQDNADELALQNPEAATFCLETGINIEAENTTLADVIAAQ